MEWILLNLKNDIKVIQTIKPNWAIEIKNKLVKLEHRSRRNNLGINGINEGKSEIWKDYEEKMN